MLRIDQNRLAADIRALAAESLALKLRLRTTWTAPMADVQHRFARTRRKLTDLHVLLAWSRGRLHVVRPPRAHSPLAAWDARAHHEAVAARVAPGYSLAELQSRSAHQ